jgi:hypothetical protein
MLSVSFSGFASAKQPLVTSSSRPQAGIQQWPVWCGLILRVAVDSGTGRPM